MANRAIPNDLAKIWFVILLIKLVAATFLPLLGDESYYWFWSHNLEWSYFDHPPAIAWLFWLGQPLEGIFNAVRIPGVLIGHLTILIWLKVLLPYLKPNKLKWFLLLTALTPLLGPGSLILTPDIPLMFTWSLCLLWITRLPQYPRAFHFLVTGLLLGLGFVSKYHIVLLVPPALLWLWKSGQLGRKNLKLLVWAVAGFFISSLPVWIWNYQNDFLSFTFQLKHGLAAKKWNPWWPVLYLASQWLLIFPTIVTKAIKNIKRAPSWLVFTAVWPILFFFLTSFKGRVESNWPIIAYPSWIALSLWGSNQMKWAKGTAVVWAVLSVTVITQGLFSWMPISPDKLRVYELTQYDEVVKSTGDLQNLYANTYQLASKLSYEHKRNIYKLKGMSRFDFFDLLDGSIPHQFPFFLLIRSKRSMPKHLRDKGYLEISRKSITNNLDLLTVDKK